MKQSIGLDFAVLSTLISVFLFTCGYIYLDSYTYFWGFNQATLGFSFQDYLIHGGTNNLLSLFFILIIFLFVSLFNSLREKDLYSSFYKVLLGVCIGILIFVYELLIKHIVKFTFKMLKNIKNILFKIKPIFSFFALIGKNIVFVLKYFLSKIGPIVINSVDKTKEAIKWDNENDTVKLEAASKDINSHYFYLVVFYLTFLFLLFYIVNEGKIGNKEATTHFNSTPSKQIILKNELLNDWLKLKNFEINYPIKAKVLLCGSNKCLIAIPSINVKNINSESIPTHNNHYIMAIESNNYIVLK